MINSIWNYISYLDKVESLFERNLLGSDKIFSEGSPNRIFSKMTEVSEKLLPYFKETLSKKEYEKLKQLIQKAG